MNQVHLLAALKPLITFPEVPADDVNFTACQLANSHPLRHLSIVNGPTLTHASRAFRFLCVDIFFLVPLLFVLDLRVSGSDLDSCTNRFPSSP